MNMHEKIKVFKRKNAKKGFTLVELVIVIAILSILAAIAIPVITTTINSAKISVMKSDTETMNMIIKECVNTSKVHLRTSVYNGNVAALATIGDVCKENNIGQGAKGLRADDGTFFRRDIGGEYYEMVYTKKHDIVLSGGDDVIPESDIKFHISATISIRDLDP